MLQSIIQKPCSGFRSGCRCTKRHYYYCTARKAWCQGSSSSATAQQSPKQHHCRTAPPIDYITQVHQHPNLALRGRSSLCIVIHDDSHTVHIQPVRLWHHSLSEPICHMVGAKQAGKHDEDLEGNNREDDRVPPLQHRPLKLDIRTLAAGQNTAGITGLTDGSFDERVKVTAAVKLILDTETAI